MRIVQAKVEFGVESAMTAFNAEEIDPKIALLASALERLTDRMEAAERQVRGGRMVLQTPLVQSALQHSMFEL